MYTELLTEKNITDACRFYGIDSEEFIDAMVSAARDILVSEEKSRVFETVFQAEYGEEFPLWKPAFEQRGYLAPGTGIPCITFLMMLVSYKKHDDRMKKYRFSDKERAINLENMRSYTFGTWKRGLDNLSFPLFNWSAEYTAGALYHCGSLIFQCCPYNFVKIHIPDNTDFSPEAVRRSLDDSVELMKEHYGMTDCTYKCDSWLLSPEVIALLPEDSNIAAFAALFNIEPKGDALSGFFTKLFRVPATTAYSILPVDTSLQRKVKAKLLAGEKFSQGSGILRPSATPKSAK